MWTCSHYSPENTYIWTYTPGKVRTATSDPRRSGSDALFQGHVLVFIPRNFCGCIQIRSRKKGYQVLPALSAFSRALTSTDKETLVLIGDPSSNQDDSDYLQMESRHGKVIVGFSGEDQYKPNEATFWQKFFGIKTS